MHGVLPNTWKPGQMSTYKHMICCDLLFQEEKAFCKYTFTYSTKLLFFLSKAITIIKMLRVWDVEKNQVTIAYIKVLKKKKTPTASRTDLVVNAPLYFGHIRHCVYTEQQIIHCNTNLVIKQYEIVANKHMLVICRACILSVSCIIFFLVKSRFVWWSMN